ncbi:VWA domain-containing protein [Aurantibacter crassamenti]|uniref:vWA domain-containing protein n=1 Tax=Aurantibacter crassamenti TaxID=1837375 RepID=UPI00193A5042|nr:VWA domain-containing protein [Aurantibacter crassamenti]MBM1107101.1 VWA domain-containing protein [Aurantibacter crassamenti]
MLKNIIPFFLFISFLSYAQKELDATTKEAINLHVDYINQCSYYIDATQHSLKAFNSTLNAYAELLDKDEVLNHNALELSYGRTAIDHKKQLNILSKKYDSLTIVRANLPVAAAKRLENELQHYQKVFNQMKTIVNVLMNFTANKAYFFEDIRFKQAYSLLHAYEKNIRTLAILSYGFNSTITDLFGEEQLPLALQRTRKMVMLSKNMIFNLGQNRNDKLEQSLSKWQQQYDIHISLEDRKILNTYGDFPYLDSSVNEDREAIDAHGKLIFQWAEKYVKGEELFVVEGLYDRTYRFEELLIDIFNSQGIGIAQKYNNYIERADQPILKIVNEVPPFNVIYPEKIYLPEENATWLTTEGIKRLLFDPTDFNTLDGALTNNMVLLIDVSISMRYHEKLDKLKNSVNYLIDVLRPQDKLTVITYSGKAEKVIETSAITTKEELTSVINSLKASGKSNGKAGLQLAYREAVSNFVHGGNNRIILASDGMFKIDNQLTNLIKQNLEKDIYLSTFHYLSPKGKISKKDVLKQLSEIGGGHYIEIHQESDAINALVTESKKQYPPE